MKVLCTGDVHIGRRSSRIPGHLDPDGTRYTSSAAWMLIVDAAIDHNVDLVAISGDLVDEENRFYEAIGAVERGLRRLAEAGIDTVAVAGNHDWDVLPRLVDGANHPRFHLLGRGGRWQRETFRRDDGSVLHVDGWSFAKRHVAIHALAEMLAPPDDGAPVLAMLHGDLDSTENRYNPIPLALLQQAPVAFWLLGHIHRSRWIPPTGASPGVLYPGSPYALSPSEGDTHGAWIVEIAPGKAAIPRCVPLSPVRYIELRIDLSAVETRDEFDPHLTHSIRTSLAGLVSSADCGPVRCISFRLVLTGRTSMHRELRGLVSDIKSDFDLDHDSVHGVIDTVQIETRPSIDLAALAPSQGLPGELARLLLALESDAVESSLEYQPLLMQTAAELRRIHQTKAYGAIVSATEPGLEAARGYVLTEGWLLLDALLAQKESL